MIHKVNNYKKYSLKKTLKTLIFIKFQIAKLIPKLLRCWRSQRFLLGEETRVPGENPQHQRGIANPAHILPRQGVKSGSHWWEVTVLATASPRCSPPSPILVLKSQHGFQECSLNFQTTNTWYTPLHDLCRSTCTVRPTNACICRSTKLNLSAVLSC